jgi:glycosyltransferase involved in cell wall biosynthesis
MIVARGYPTEKYKMNGIFEFDQAKALVRAGCKVVYVAIDVRSIRRWRKWGIEQKIIDGVKVYAINIPCGRIPKTIRQRISIIGFRILYSIIIKSQGKPELIHAHFASISYTVSKVINKLNIPLVITEHLSTMMNSTIDKRLFKIANHAYDNADSIIAVSPELKDVIKKRFNKNAIYIPNIVDTELFTFSENNIGVKDNKFKFVSVGSLIPRKRMDLAIKAFTKAFHNIENVKLTIFGEGSERQRLEQIIRDCHMENKICLMGLKSRREIAEYMKGSNCFVLASQAETFGVVYIEAMASGLPVIATECGGPESIVNDKNGRLVPVDNIESLIKAMKYMYTNAKEYNNEHIAMDTKNKFSDKIISEKLINLYEKLILS